jgi:hypothetical protein
MAKVKVEGMEWDVAHVASFASADEFSAVYASDVDVYPRKANKAEILALVYKAAVPEPPKPVKKESKPKE